MGILDTLKKGDKVKILIEEIAEVAYNGLPDNPKEIKFIVKEWNTVDIKRIEE